MSSSATSMSFLRRRNERNNRRVGIRAHAPLNPNARNVGNKLPTLRHIMIAMSSAETEIQGLRMALIHSYQEPEDAALVVVLAEAVSGPKASVEELALETNAVLRDVKAVASPTIVSAESKLYMFSWQSIIAFMVMDELRGHLPRGVSTGRWFRRFSSSPLLDYARSNIFLYDDATPLYHSQVGAIDRHIDVLSDVEPTIERIR
jgi:hypothetical protein